MPRRRPPPLRKTPLLLASRSVKGSDSERLRFENVSYRLVNKASSEALEFVKASGRRARANKTNEGARETWRGAFPFATRARARAAVAVFFLLRSGALRLPPFTPISKEEQRPADGASRERVPTKSPLSLQKGSRGRFLAASTLCAHGDGHSSRISGVGSHLSLAKAVIC